MGKLIKGKNDLATKRPDLVEEWNYEKNGNLKPEDFLPGSCKKVWWICKHGHEWEATIGNRTYKQTSCPHCSRKRTCVGVTDLTTQNPDLAAEWNYKKNKDLMPEDVTAQSHKKVWWIGKCGHEWEAIIKNRNNHGSGCPYCSGRFPIKGKTDLASTNPEIASQWHPTKNGELTPHDVTSTSKKKVWWQCSEGHEWQAVIYSRTHGRNCPYCAGQRVIPGTNDLESQRPQLAKQFHPTKNGKLTPKDIAYRSGKKVWWQCSEGHEWEAVVGNRSAGRQCPYCSGHKVLSNFNDLQTKNPALAAQWHPTKNGDLTPDNVTCNSNKKVWWLGTCGHEWKATINNRNNGSNCPYCAGKRVLQNFNDIASHNPELINEFHPTKNGELTPESIAYKSNRKIWWICKFGHEWKATVASRSSGTGCPYCAGKKVIRGETDLSTTHPDIANEWHPTKNRNLMPYDVSQGSHKKIWWICERNHEWQAAVKDRVRGYGCPYCSASHGEKSIKKILDQLNIIYLHNKGLSDCCYKQQLQHDFILLSENRVIATIEYNGEQHYRPIAFHKEDPKITRQKYEITVCRDTAKTAWLKEHGIPQLIIPYWEFDNIEQIIKDFLDSDEVKQSKESNQNPIFI